MEEGRQTKKSIASWALVGIVFIAIIIFLVIKFMRQGEDNAKNQSQDKLVNYVNMWAGVVRSEALAETEAGNVFVEEINRNNYKPGDNDTLEYARFLVKNTDISHVVFCKGDKVIRDENGNDVTVDLSAFSGEEPCYRITEAYCDQMLTAYIPCKDDGSYMLIMESLNTVGNMFMSSSYEEVSFLSLMDKSGDIVGTFLRGKDTDSTYLTNGNISKAISAGSASAESYSSFNVKLQNGMSAAIEAAYNNDARTIASTSVGLEDWYLTFGVRQSYVDKLIASLYKNVKSTVIDLIVVISIFTIFVVSTMVFSSLRTKERGRVLEDKADTDLLTELNNKAATERKIQEYLQDNPNGRAMMFILDIDNFKKINDTMGHAFGDTLLKTLGKEIKTEFRMTDIIGRTGGDEFMVFLKDVTDDLIVEREANRITRFFHDFKAGGDYVKYSATASIGAAIYPDDAKNFKDLYVAADQALYKAKKRGKNQLCFYNEAVHK